MRLVVGLVFDKGWAPGVEDLKRRRLELVERGAADVELARTDAGDVEFEFAVHADDDDQAIETARAMLGTAAVHFGVGLASRSTGLDGD